MFAMTRRTRTAMTLGTFLGLCACSHDKPVESSEDKTDETRQAVALAESAADLCARVDGDPALPVYCDLTLVEDVPTMVFAFPNAAAFEAYVKPMAERVGVPFCASLGALHKPGTVVMGAENQFYKVDCATGQLSAANGREVSDDAREDITIGQVCEAIAAQHLPVGCGIADLQDETVLVLPYRKSPAADELLPQLGALVGVPFCNAANASQTSASLLLVEDDARGRRYDCARGTWGNVFGLRRTRRQAQPQLAAYTSRRPKYELLPESGH